MRKKTNHEQQRCCVCSRTTCCCTWRVGPSRSSRRSRACASGPATCAGGHFGRRPCSSRSTARHRAGCTCRSSPSRDASSCPQCSCSRCSPTRACCSARTRSTGDPPCARCCKGRVASGGSQSGCIERATGARAPSPWRSTRRARRSDGVARPPDALRFRTRARARTAEAAHLRRGSGDLLQRRVAGAEPREDPNRGGRAGVVGMNAESGTPICLRHVTPSSNRSSPSTK